MVISKDFPAERCGYPSLYEINTRVFLNELSAELGREARFSDVPDSFLDWLAERGFHYVWFLGIWQTGEAGRRVALAHPELRLEYGKILSDFDPKDVCGSPFAIKSYAVHSDFGSVQDLIDLRGRLWQRGLGLFLDFVPNHTALDHPWVQEHPEYYVHGSEKDFLDEPGNYLRVATGSGDAILAHGRDPYFPGWTDTLQLNYRHPGLRRAMTEVLLNISDLADGVRCDMAMLILPEIIARTWGGRSLPIDGDPPADTCFWQDVIPRVRAKNPHFLFMAEVYWDLEWTLMQQGFDYAYDKRLYDRLRAPDAASVRGHLMADLAYQQKLARFLENHDEPRAASSFPADEHRAAAMVTFFAPGMRFFHQGQLEGRLVHIPMQLARGPHEPVDEPVRDFYLLLLDGLKRAEIQYGDWKLLNCRSAWEGNPTWENFIAYGWQGADGLSYLVTVNYGPTQGQCYVELPFGELAGNNVVLQDLMSDKIYERNGDDLNARGLYLDIPEWKYHLFEIKSR